MEFKINKMGNTINNYVFKALDAYHYDIEETMEALNYALSYDDQNTMALTLMGRVYAERLYKYTEAISYFEQVLAIDTNALEVYAHYIDVLLWNEDLKKANTFIDFALTVKGSDKALLYLKKSAFHEQLKEYKKALNFLKLAKEHTFNSTFLETVTEQKERIKEKMPKKKKRKSSKKDKKAKKK